MKGNPSTCLRPRVNLQQPTPQNNRAKLCPEACACSPLPEGQDGKPHCVMGGQSSHRSSGEKSEAALGTAPGRKAAWPAVWLWSSPKVGPWVTISVGVLAGLWVHATFPALPSHIVWAISPYQDRNRQVPAGCYSKSRQTTAVPGCFEKNEAPGSKLGKVKNCAFV